MKHYCPTGRRNHGRPLKRLLDTWDRNGTTSGPNPRHIYDDDDDDKHVFKASDARRITEAEMKYMRRTAGYTWTDYKTNAQITKELKVTPILDKLLEYKRSWIQHVNRIPRIRLPRVMKHYSPTGRRNHGRPFKRLLDTWYRNGSTSGPTPWQIYDDDDDDEELRWV